jgi:hypothetical protein
MERSCLHFMTADPFREVLDAKTEERPYFVCNLNRQATGLGTEHTA